MEISTRNAAVHTPNCTKAFSVDMDIDALDWTSRSPDLNPIKKFWGFLVGKSSKDHAEKER